MTFDRLFVELNHASREWSQALAGRLSNEEMLTKVGEHWTFDIGYAHIAFRDRCVIHVLDMTGKRRQVVHPGNRHLRERTVASAVGSQPAARELVRTILAVLDKAEAGGHLMHR